jgi:predicted Zn-dependent protease
MKRAALLLVLLAFAAPGQAQFNINLNRLLDVGKNVRQAAGEIDEKEEIELGRDVAAQLLGAAPLVPNEALQTYVNRVGRWLASQTERSGLPWFRMVLGDI